MFLKNIQSIAYIFTLTITSVTFAQDFGIGWYTIDSGGGFSSGNDFELEGTIGQSDAGFASGGDYSLESGFWHANTITLCDGDAACLDENVCSYNFCDTSGCEAFSIRYGDVAEPFGGLVQTSDILCAVQGFGNYSACPNADIAGCALSGIPIATNDILAIVAAFGGEDPCGCSGPSAASETAGTAMTTEPLLGTGDAVVTLRSQAKSARVNDLVSIDVFVSNAPDMIGYEIRANKNINGLTFDSVSVDELRRDYAFAHTESVAALDQSVGRIGGVAIHEEFAEAKEFYIGTFNYRVEEIVEDSVSITLNVLDVELFRNANELIDVANLMSATVEIESADTNRISLKR